MAKMWAGRTDGATEKIADDFNSSIHFDSRMYRQDITGSMTHAVKTKFPNELGIYDMSGNVYEWCQDWYGSYSSNAQTNPKGPSNGSDRVLRGGSWDNNARHCRVSDRNHCSPRYSCSNYGLRLVLVP